MDDSKPPSADFDQALFMELMMDDLDLAQAVARQVLSDASERRSQLAAAVSEGELQQIIMQLHSLKGMMANCGCEALSALAGDLEAAAKSGQVDGVRSRMPEFDDRIARSFSELESFASRN